MFAKSIFVLLKKYVISILKVWVCKYYQAEWCVQEDLIILLSQISYDASWPLLDAGLCQMWQNCNRSYLLIETTLSCGIRDNNDIWFSLGVLKINFVLDKDDL